MSFPMPFRNRQGRGKKSLILQPPKGSSSHPPPFQRQFVDCLKEHVPSVRTLDGPPFWVVVHVMVKCIDGLYDLWRVREVYTLAQAEHHHALTRKFSKAWGDSRWSPSRWFHCCLAHSALFAEKWRKSSQFSSISTEYKHEPYKRRLKNCFKGWSLVRPSLSLGHMHYCMSMNTLEQGLLGLEAEKVRTLMTLCKKKDRKCFVPSVLPCLSH